MATETTGSISPEFLYVCTRLVQEGLVKNHELLAIVAVASKNLRHFPEFTGFKRLEHAFKLAFGRSDEQEAAQALKSIFNKIAGPLPSSDSEESLNLIDEIAATLIEPHLPVEMGTFVETSPPLPDLLHRLFQGIHFNSVIKALNNPETVKAFFAAVEQIPPSATSSAHCIKYLREVRRLGYLKNTFEVTKFVRLLFKEMSL